MRYITASLLFLAGCASSAIQQSTLSAPRFAPSSAQEEAADALSPASLPTTPPASAPTSKPKLIAGSATLEKADIDYLSQRNLLLPVDGVVASKLSNTFDAPRSGGRVHKACDILSPYNTLIYATADGAILKLHSDPRGGISIYELDAGGSFMYYYAHLDHYADGLKEGQPVKRGDLLGYVGDTGNAKGTPHLHFSIFKVTDPKVWWQGVSINPYFLLTQKPYPGF